jgi:hypothetical protein
VGAAGAAGTARAGALPLFTVATACQPTLSVWLRRLLATGRPADAVAVASAASTTAPHFARSLEWLVAAALVSGDGGGGGGAGGGSSSTAHPPAPPPLLTAATALARRFPSAFADTVVAVARKTDAALWPVLFAAAGPPSDLLCDAAAAGALDGAACCLLVVDRVEGPAAAAGPALHLLKAALEAGRYPLAAELLRFACPPGGWDGEEGGGAAAHAPALTPTRTALRPPRVLGRAPALPWRRRVEGRGQPASKTSQPASTGWLPALWRTVAPPPAPTALAAAAAAEEEAAAPAAAAAWCQLAAHAWRLVAGREVAGLAALGRALAADGADLGDALCCVPRPSIVAAVPATTGGGGGEDEDGGGAEPLPPAPRRMSGATVVELMQAAGRAFPAAVAGGGAPASGPAASTQWADVHALADATAAAGEADWAVGLSVLAVAGNGGGGGGGASPPSTSEARLGALVEEHALLWASFVEAAGCGEKGGQATPCRVSPAVRSVVERVVRGGSRSGG